LETGPWSWLEVAKLAASLLTPVVVAIFGVYLHRVTKRFEHSQWRSQKLIEKRLGVEGDGPTNSRRSEAQSRQEGPPCRSSVFARVFRGLHGVPEPLFRNLCRWGVDARLRTQFKRRKDVWGTKWDTAAWEQLFSDDASDPQAIRAAYREVMEAFAADLGVVPAAAVPQSGRVPGNIR
jgi:hypothetical protein